MTTSTAEEEAGDATTASSNENNKKKKQAPQATVAETLSFAFTNGTQNSIIFFIGVLGAIGNGAVSHKEKLIALYLYPR
jgi:hypothetical protein